MADHHINILLAAKDMASLILAKAGSAIGSFGNTIGAAAQRARGSVPALMLLTQSFGDIPGSVGKAVKSLSAIASSFMAFGPAGAIISGAIAGFSALQKHITEKCEKIEEAAKSMIAAVSKKIKMQFEIYVNGAKADFDVVAAKIKDVENAMEDRQRTVEINAADLGILDAKGQAELKALQDEIAKDNAANPGDKLIAAQNAADFAEAYLDALGRELARKNFNQRLALDMQWQNAGDLERHAVELAAAAREVAAKLDNFRETIEANGETENPEMQKTLSALEAAASKANEQAQSARERADAAGHQFVLMSKQLEKDTIDREAVLNEAKTKLETAETQLKQVEGEKEAEETNRANAELLAQAKAHEDAMQAEKDRQKAAAEKAAAEKAAAEKQAEIERLKKEREDLKAEIAEAKATAPAAPYQDYASNPIIKAAFERYLQEHGGLPSDTAKAERRRERVWAKFIRNMENKMDSIANRSLDLSTVGNKMDEVVAAARAARENNANAHNYESHWDYVKGCEKKLDDVNKKLDKAITVQ